MPASTSYENALESYQNSLELIQEEYPHVDLKAIKRDLIDISKLNKNERVPTRIIAHNARTAIRYLDEPLLGIKVVDRYDWSHIPIFNLLRTQFPPSNSQSHLGEMVIFLTEYLSTTTEAADISLSWQKNRLRLNIIPRDDFLPPTQIEGVVYGIKKLLLLLTHCNPLLVDFMHSAPTYPEYYQSYFDVVPNFDQENYALVYEAKQRFEAIDDTSINAVSGLNSLLQKEFPELDFAQKCKTILKSIMHFGEPSRERVSGLLFMSVSTFKRKLKEQGVSFKDILLELRKDMAKDMLVKQNLTATQTAFFLGYQNEAQFFKAFKLWFGVTPGEYKEKNAS